MRRPLACGCLIICLCLFLYVMFFDNRHELFELTTNLAGTNVQLLGKVVNKEIRNDNQVIYLKSVSIENTNYFPQNEKEKIIEYFNEKVLKKNYGFVCYLDSSGNAELKMGTLLCLEGKLDAFKSATNEGEFDMSQYYLSTGYLAPVYKCKVIAEGSNYDYLRQMLYQLRKNLSELADEIFIENDAGIMKAMLLGEKTELDSDIKSLYQKAGISHILAISGLHISLIGMFLYNLLKKLRINLYIRVSLTIVIMLLYGQMTGMGTSTMRALIMFILVLMSYLVKRTYDLPTALGIAGVIISILNILSYISSSFYMSFMAVAGIAIFSKTILIKKKSIGKIKVKFLNSILSSFAVSYFTLPVLLYSYFEYPTYSIFLNLLILPLMGVLLGCGVIAILIGVIYIPVAKIIAFFCHIILLIYERISQFTMKLPYNHIVMGRPKIWQILAFYTICLCLCIYCKYIEYKKNMAYASRLLLKKRMGNKNSKIKEYRERWIVKLVFILAGILVIIKVPSALTVSFIDVGQGDGICIESKDFVAFIDGGSSSKKDLAKYQLIPVIKSKGISKVDYWFVSHPDSDHTSGLIEILKDKQAGIKIEHLVLPMVNRIYEDAGELITLANENSIDILYVKQGDILRYEDLSFEIINPVANKEYSDVNEYSEVILFCYSDKKRDYKMLFTGDSTVESEEAYLDYCTKHSIIINDIDLLKVAHHGSNTSSSTELIERLQPRISIISAGKNNSYGHPHREILERFVKYAPNSKIYRTDECGEVTVKINNEGVVITRFLDIN